MTSEESEKYISNLIESEYKDYPELIDFKESLIKMYIKQYRHISQNKKYFNIREGNEIEVINLVFEKMKLIWKNIYSSNERSLKEDIE